MRAPNNKRSRGRTNRRSPNPNRSYESNGPDGKIRGNANQVYDKYSQLARDASASGDLIAAEGYWQHAEHYYRIMMSMQQNKPQNQNQNQQDNNQNNDDQQDDQQGNQNAQQSNERQPADPAEQEQPRVDEPSGDGADDSDTAGLERAMRRSRPRRQRKPRDEDESGKEEAEKPNRDRDQEREAAEDAAD